MAVNIDVGVNPDWIKSRRWDMATPDGNRVQTVTELVVALGGKGKTGPEIKALVQHFMTLPASQPMPWQLRQMVTARLNRVRKATDDKKGHWVTMSGRHVYIDSGGGMHYGGPKGPAVDKKSLKNHSPHAKKGEDESASLEQQKKIASTPPHKLRSKEFDKYPGVMYHGAEHSWPSFPKDAANFWTTRRNIAKQYASGDAGLGGNEHGIEHVHSALINIKKPASREDIANVLKGLHVTPDEIERYGGTMDDYGDDDYTPPYMETESLYVPRVRVALEKAGFDGYVGPDNSHNGVPIAITFHGSQVKQHHDFVDAAKKRGETISPDVEKDVKVNKMRHARSARDRAINSGEAHAQANELIDHMHAHVQQLKKFPEYDKANNYGDNSGKISDNLDDLDSKTYRGRLNSYENAFHKLRRNLKASGAKVPPYAPPEHLKWLMASNYLDPKTTISKADDADGHWITIKGRHVFIDGEGKMHYGGPKGPVTTEKGLGKHRKHGTSLKDHQAGVVKPHWKGVKGSDGKIRFGMVDSKGDFHVGNAKGPVATKESIDKHKAHYDPDFHIGSVADHLRRHKEGERSKDLKEAAVARGIPVHMFDDAQDKAGYPIVDPKLREHIGGFNHDLAVAGGGINNQGITRAAGSLWKVMSQDPEAVAAMKQVGVENPPEYIAGVMECWHDEMGSPETLSMQLVTNDLFNLGFDKKMQQHMFEYSEDGDENETREYHKIYEPALKAIAKHTYDETQRLLKEEGIDQVRLYRGMSFPDRESVPKGFPKKEDDYAAAKVTGQPLSSFAANINSAHSYSSSSLQDASKSASAYIIAADVPRSMIFATPRTGFGAWTEDELLVMRGPLNAAVQHVGFGDLDEDEDDD